MIAVLLANGFEEIEALTPIDMLRRAGLEVITVGIDSSTATGSHGIPVICDITSAELDASQVDTVILPGGMPGATNLAESEFVRSLVTSVYERGGRIAAICAAPLVLGRLGLLEGKRATCYPGFEGELIGATVTGAPVVTDGGITTARGMGVALEFSKELVSLLVGEEKTEELSKAIMEPTDEDTEAIIEDIENICSKILDMTSVDDTKKETSEQDGDAASIEQLLNDIETILSENDDENITVDPSRLGAKEAFSSYELPSTEIFTKSDNEAGGHDGEVAEIAHKILEVLREFGVAATIDAFAVGPRIAKYYIAPERKTKVKSILNLFDDIALSLAVEGIRMTAPVSGDSTIGIEVPLRNPSLLRFGELVESEEFQASESLTTVCLGRDVCGTTVVGKIEKMPHLLIGGATGMGKSVCINNIIASVLCKAKPDEVKLLLIDPKGVEFNCYKDLPHLLCPVITTATEAVGALKWALGEMERRYDILDASMCRNIDSYNAKVAESPELGSAMPRILIVIDELNDLMCRMKKPVEGFIMCLTQKARAAGIHLIIATQRPSVDVLTGVIKANIPTRISFKVVSSIDSRTILDAKGAEKLLNKGDMLYLPAGRSQPERIQLAFISDDEIERLVGYVKCEAGAFEYDKSVCDEIARIAEEITPEKQTKKSESNDEYIEGFIEALRIAVSNGKVSTSLLQRKLSIGYGKAAKYIDAMEEFGFISPPNGQKPRDVLITAEELEAKLKKIGY